MLGSLFWDSGGGINGIIKIVQDGAMTYVSSLRGLASSSLSSGSSKVSIWVSKNCMYLICDWD